MPPSLLERHAASIGRCNTGVFDTPYPSVAWQGTAHNFLPASLLMQHKGTSTLQKHQQSILPPRFQPGITRDNMSNPLCCAVLVKPQARGVSAARSPVSQSAASGAAEHARGATAAWAGG